MSRLRRRGGAVLAVAGALTGLSFVVAPAAGAHPLGNTTVNHYDGLTLHPDRVDVLGVEDIAELPTLQRQPDIDTNGDGTVSPAEARAYAASQCAALTAAARVSVDGRRVTLTLLGSDYAERPGAVGLTASRLECRLQGPADLSRPATVTIDDEWDSEGIGWHEVSLAGDGVAVLDSALPAASRSDELRHYPNNLLSSPLDIRGGTVSVRPGDGSTYRRQSALPTAGAPLRALNDLANQFNDLVGRKHLTVGVGLLAVLLSMLLGAGHAFLPGHGKTIMAAYLVGRRGRRRDVVTVGATVTLTHTAGVLVLGALISLTTAFAPAAAEQYLGIVSGLLVMGVGVGLLVGALRRRRAGRAELEHVLADLQTPERVLVGAEAASSVHPTSTAAVPVEGQAHEHGHGHGHGHEHGHGHREPQRFGRGGLIGLGVAGGLVPSPSALLVLLAAVALGRTAFGVVLVLGYGLGMAGALTVAGLVLVRLRNRLGPLLERRAGAFARFSEALPVVTAVLVLVVGAGLALRAVGGSV